MANKKDPKETIETTTEETVNNENNNNESQEETVMNENVNNTQENTQAEATQTAAPVKEKKHMPVWLKYTIAGVIGIGAGIGGTLAVQHFTGDSAEEFNSNMFD